MLYKVTTATICVIAIILSVYQIVVGSNPTLDLISTTLVVAIIVDLLGFKLYSILKNR